MNDWSAVKVLALFKFSATVCAAVPVYEPEKVSDPLVAERAASVPPNATPEIVECDSPVLSNVPVTVGVIVSAPAVGTMFCPIVSPLNVRVEVEKATAVCVVLAYPEPRAVR